MESKPDAFSVVMTGNVFCFFYLFHGNMIDQEEHLFELNLLMGIFIYKTKVVKHL